MTQALKDDYSPLIENRFVSLIETKSGIVFDNIKRREIKKNLVVCMEELREPSFHQYFQHLISPGGEDHLKKLINFITINETFFFRVAEHFDLLMRVAVPAILQQKEASDRFIRVWSAGSSSGEEIYSIIITLLEMQGVKENFQLEVLGTDINDDMLYLARKGIYSGRTLGKVSPWILQNYFEPFLTDRYRVNEEVRQHARFEYLNLAQPFDLDFFGRPDVIFFRNVLIYFNKETTARIIDMFYHMLKPGGYLFLGPSESLWEISDKFELLMFDNAFIYRKKSDWEPSINGKPLLPSTDIEGVSNLYAQPNKPIWTADAFAVPPGGTSPKEEPGQTFAPDHPDEAEVPKKGILPTIESLSDQLAVENPGPTDTVDITQSAESSAGTADEVAGEPAPIAYGDNRNFPAFEDKLRILLDEAGLMVELGDYVKAGKLLDEVLAADSGNKAAMLLRLTLLANQERRDLLMEYADQIGGLYPVFPELHFLMGRYYEAAGLFKEAVKKYNVVLFIDRDYLLARERLLRIAVQKKEEGIIRREANNILDQLNSGRFKEFEHSVGETVIRDRLKKYCIKSLA
ncbi:MAG: hypothetical protein GY765_24805 [bacterium]|nr:hypothetical protein [bacterium]